MTYEPMLCSVTPSVRYKANFDKQFKSWIRFAKRCEEKLYTKGGYRDVAY